MKCLLDRISIRIVSVVQILLSVIYIAENHVIKLTYVDSVVNSKDCAYTKIAKVLDFEHLNLKQN